MMELADMLKNFVEVNVDQILREKYPHIQHPAAVYAHVVRVSEADGTCTCTVQILDSGMNRNTDFPEIPGVKTKISLRAGDTVVALLVYGGCNVFILGRYEG
jgi:hypothetical protein